MAPLSGHPAASVAVIIVTTGSARSSGAARPSSGGTAGAALAHPVQVALQDALVREGDVLP